VPGFAKAAYFLVETFSCKAQIAAVSISMYGILNMSFQHIRTSLRTTGFGFPLSPSLPSSAVAEVQPRSVIDGITRTAKVWAGLQHTWSLVCRLSTPAPHGWDGASPPTAAPPGLGPVRAQMKQKDIKKRCPPLTKGPLTKNGSCLGAGEKK